MVPLKATRLIQVANLGKPPDTVRIELLDIICANLQFRMHREVFELVSRYMNTVGD